MNGRNSIVVSSPTSNGADGQDGRGDQRQGELGDRRPEHRDGLGRPQLQEVGVAEQAAARGSVIDQPSRRSGRGRVAMPGDSGESRIGRVLVESVPNVSEGRRLDVVDRLAEALVSVPGVHLLDRTSDASHNRSVFTIAGEHEAVADGARGARRAGASPTSTWRRTRASTRGSAPSTSSRSSRSATRRWTTASSSPGAFGARIAERYGTCPSTCTRRRRPAPTG